MLGVQDTRSAGSPKTYSCVACSATFHSLSSLLVHQASHASEASHQPESTLPTCVSCGSLFASKDLLEKHHCVTLPSPIITFVCDCGEEFSDCIAFEDHKMQHDSENTVQLDLERSSVVPESKIPTCVSCGNLFATMDLLEKHQCVKLPTPASPASLAHLYICDCGKEFGDFTTLEEHKKQHGPENKMESAFERIPVVTEKKTDFIRLISDQVFHSLSPLAFNEKLLAPIPPSTSDSVTKMTESTTDMESNILQSSELHFVTEEQVQTLEEDNDTLNSSIEPLNHSLHDNEKSPESCKESDAVNSGLMDQDSGEKKKSILKILASAYMSHKQPVQMKQRNLPPRKVSPRAPIQPPPTVIISKPEPLKIQSTPSKETVSVQPARMFSKKGKIISVTQTLCPVVVLETRQKLFGRDNVEGRHQCRLCRRVFQDLDTLIMHHALHKKERVKFCLYCQQFVITVISVPENHICFSAFSKNIQPLTAKMSSEPVIPTAQQLEKIFYCSLCKRGYARIRSLKRHNCPCKAPLKSASPTVNRVELKTSQNLESSNTAMQNSKNNQMSTHHVNIGVGTEPIKVEEQHTEFPIDKKNQIHPPKTPERSSKPTESTINSVKLPENMARMKEEEKEKLAEKQWTMPLDDAEIDTLIDGEQKDSDEDDLADMDEDDCYEEDVADVESSEETEIDSDPLSEGYQVFITNKGVKRYVCIECQRSYSRQFTLKEHLKVCEARILKEQTIENKIADLPVPIKKFPCPQCGKFFSRKDNMNMHQKKCHGKTAVPAVSPRTEPKTPVAQENLFVLSPSTENKAVQQETPQNSSSSRNWGIMSLPSVLPRKVTCECGASFTCPRLLFEHLQQHAQESYICPHCGENLQSWMDFEAHQQLHKQSQSANEQRGPQQRPHTFSQALPLHAPTRPQQSPGFSEHKPPALLPPQHLNNGPDTEPLTCPRCKKNFSQRSSLARHIRLRCTGDPTTQKKHPCTRCGATFLNPLNLKIHVQSNTCKPAFKPIRCPVCVRWFSCLDGLKRHLVSHSRQAVCQICDQNCPNLQALEEHKRKVHGLNNRMRPEENAPNSSSQPSVENSLTTPFQCHVCLRYYPKLQSLKDHLRKVHRPKQPKQINLSTTEPVRIGQFLCQICGRSYPTIKSLKNHRRRVHNILGAVFPPMKGPEQNSTPGQFQCHICSRSYPDVQSLRNHRRRVHGIVGGLDVSKGVAQHNLYKCLICQRSYPDEISLKNHRRRVHRILGPVPEPSVSTIATNDIEDDLDQKPIPFL